MASLLQGQGCWRAARPCPMTETSSGEEVICRAWFRCQTAGDYVIRWRCQSADEGANVTSTNLSICPNQLNSREVLECPPPVVCADDPYQGDVEIMEPSLSTDVILATALASFAFLALLLIIASTYKYWVLRKRLRLRFQPRHYIMRDFPYPVRYHSLWGAGYHGLGADTTKKTPSPHTYRSTYPDVYFSRPYESSRHFEHLLTSSEDSIENNMGEFHPHLSPSRVRPGCGQFKADPSVITGSFVFHQPVVMGSTIDGKKDNGRADNRVHHSRPEHKDSDSDKSDECFHIYKGNLSKYRPQENHYASTKHMNQKSEYIYNTDASTDFTRAPRVSSITIPSYDYKVPQQSKDHHHNGKKQDYQVREENADLLHTQKEIYDSSSSRSSVSPYALGLMSFGSHEKRYNIDNNGQNNLTHQNHGVTAKSIPANNSTNGHSPDVISSHNFTNKFVRVGKNIYRSFLANSNSSLATTSNNNNKSNMDLSYDSFRNDHLRELAKRGAASSSTLEAGYRQKGQNVVTQIPGRF